MKNIIPDRERVDLDERFDKDFAPLSGASEKRLFSVTSVSQITLGRDPAGRDSRAARINDGICWNIFEPGCLVLHETNPFRPLSRWDEREPTR
jgi:hypothetical protein